MQEEKTKDTIEIYIDYVTQQIKKLDEYTNLVHDGSISWYEANVALSNVLKIHNVLSSEIQRLKIVYTYKKRSFDLWYNKLYIEQRQENNKPELAAQKWCSAKELHALVMVANEDEYMKKSEEIENIDLRINFLDSLKKDWTSAMYSYAVISNNLKTEYFGELTSNKQPIDTNQRIPIKR